MPDAYCRLAQFLKATSVRDEPILAERVEPAEKREEQEIDVDFSMGADLLDGTATLFFVASDDSDRLFCNGEV